MGYYDLNSPRLTLDMAVGTGYVVETGLFCIYTYLFIAALPMLTSARRLKNEYSARTARIFLIMSILMYLVAILHLISEAFRFYRGIILINNPKDRIAYLQNANNWEFLGSLVFTYIQAWLGDALVIYRCYVVWGNNKWLIALPALLLLGTIAVHSYVMYWVGHQVNNLATANILSSLYPLAFAQNFWTTTLIILKIVLQHHQSKKAGIVHMGSKLGLAHVIRVVIESAAIYTIQLLLINILYFRNNQFQFVVQVAIIPSIGITFLLLAIRLEASRNHHPTTRSDLGVRTSMIPRLFVKSNPDSETGVEDYEGDEPKSS